MFQSQVEDLESPISVDTQHVILIDQDFNALDLHPFYLFHAWERTGLQNHLCFLKQVLGEPPNIKTRIESTHGVGETDLSADYGLSQWL